MALRKSKAKANPTRAFFVHTITRDISIDDCILDLIDNSVDSAREQLGQSSLTSFEREKSFKRFSIDLTLGPDGLAIRDNCGGISLDDAADYAFTFGGQEGEDAIRAVGIGVYGIGMKRAVFKMGKSIAVRSTYNENGDAGSFCVRIDVPSWLSDKSADWDFQIDEDEPLDASGVEIQVEDLTEECRAAFSDPGFVQDLMRTISRDYLIPLHNGLSITVNGEPISGWSINFMVGDQFSPVRKGYHQGTGKTRVNVEVVAGAIASPPESSEPEEDIVSEDRSGWYVVCNNRVVLAADRTSASGWGTQSWPKWHPQYSGFVGFVFFTSKSADNLPLTTTKRGVDQASLLYRSSLNIMREVSKDWIAYTNGRKNNLEKAERIEDATRSVSLFKVEERGRLVLPELRGKKKEKLPNILYQKPKAQIEALAEAFGDVNMSQRAVGIESFDYAYAELVGGE